MIKATLGGVGFVADSLRGLGQVEASAVVVAMGTVLHEEVRANLSLHDHSLKDLAALDHPYATRHGSIQEGTLGHPGFQVHRQSGELLRSLRGEVLEPGDRFGVWLDPTIAEHATYVIEGTPKMLPRDTLWTTAADKGVQQRMMKAVVRVLGKELRTKGMIRFGKGR